MGEAARVFYEFIWDELCDWYIELVKPRLYGKETEASRSSAQQVLSYVLQHTLELLHPFMPFLTEEIWQHLTATAAPEAAGRQKEEIAKAGHSIMIAPWPEWRPELEDTDSEAQISLLMDVIREHPQHAGGAGPAAGQAGQVRGDRRG